ncbi:MAG: sigma-54-dependent transcriptional regulator [Candidatus Kapaibacteriota bacterium]
MEVLIVDDNAEFCSTMDDIIRSFSYNTKIFNFTTQALNYIKENSTNIGLALFDIEFSKDDPMSGIDLLEIIRMDFPFIPVVMISGKGTISTAVKATKLGAVNFIEKSVLNKDKIREILESSMLKDFSEDDEEIRRFLLSCGIVAKSRSMIEIGKNIIRFGRTDLNILITGETGTGKRLVAKAIHLASRRNKHPFITVDIPNIPRDLFQSELFGHIKGAFSGASDSKKGLFHEAAHGSIFLDEIGDLSLDLQSNLFIPVDEKVIRRVGSVQSEEVDIRFISATDRDLVKLMEEGKFREQLYHRLRECEINIPPLSERIEDIPDIINYYVQMHNQDYGDSKYFSQPAIDFLAEQQWKGNVRELASVIKVAVQTINEEEIKISHIDKVINSNYRNSSSQIRTSTTRSLKEDLAEVDRIKIENTLKLNNGNVSKSAAMLDVSRETLHIKIRKYGIDVQKFRKK